MKAVRDKGIISVVGFSDHHFPTTWVEPVHIYSRIASSIIGVLEVVKQVEAPVELDTEPMSGL